MTLTIRIVKEHRSCNACGAQNYHAVSDSICKPKYADKIYEIVIGNMVNAVCPECVRTLANTATILLDGVAPQLPAEDTILIHVRDCNGRRDIIECRDHAEVLHWAEEEMSKEDEILLITQGGICIYSQLQAGPTLTLTRDDITGFFA